MSKVNRTQVPQQKCHVNWVDRTLEGLNSRNRNSSGSTPVSLSKQYTSGSVDTGWDQRKLHRWNARRHVHVQRVITKIVWASGRFQPRLNEKERQGGFTEELYCHPYMCANSAISNSLSISLSLYQCIHFR